MNIQNILKATHYLGRNSLRLVRMPVAKIFAGSGKNTLYFFSENSCVATAKYLTKKMGRFLPYRHFLLSQSCRVRVSSSEVGASTQVMDVLSEEMGEMWNQKRRDVVQALSATKRAV